MSRTSIKREVAALIPYRVTRNVTEIYLQKRTEDAPTNPGCFGLFGGGIEQGESPEMALVREVREELNYALPSFELFNVYDFPDHIFWVYGQEVDDLFENMITVLEGQYGQWFTKTQMEVEEKINPFNRIIYQDVFRRLGERSSK